MSKKFPAYIVNVHPMLINDTLVWDVYYLRETSRDIYCLRIFNIQLSFLVARLPNLSLSQFQRYIDTFVPKHLKTFVRTDLADSSYFNFGRNREYIEIFAPTPKELADIQKKMEEAFKTFYSRIRENELSAEDALFFRNTETPFRYTSSTLSLTNTVYNLSTKYNIPLVGGVIIDSSKFSKVYPQDFSPDFPSNRIAGLNAQLAQTWDPVTVNQNITECIQRDEKVDLKHNMTMFAYDIETYNPDADLNPETTPETHYIFCIGIGVFDLTNTIPRERYCLITKDFAKKVYNPDTNVELKMSTVPPAKAFGRKGRMVYNEYQHYIDPNEVIEQVTTSESGCDDEEGEDALALRGSKVITSKHTVHSIPTEEYKPEFPDQTLYVICKDELDLLNCFNQITQTFKPQIICGFNSFGFDDNYMFQRMKIYGIEQEYLQCFTYYEILDSSLPRQWWFKPFVPDWREFELKIDNEQRKDNKSVRAWSVLNVDVYKMMLKEDPKRFTQYGRGNLDTMLEAYDIHNPYNKQPLSKTGLKIHEMYRRWDADENIYSIALYCCQDSWICGTLLIERAKLSDLIEMAGISCTMFGDSIYRADGVRVANSILSYAYDEKFALMDTAYKLRSDLRKDPTLPRLGGKTYDHRTIVGGQVRNIHAGRQWFVVALDFSAMYPSQKEASNIDSSSRIDDDVIKHPEKYGINIVRKLPINDMYGKREVFYVKKA